MHLLKSIGAISSITLCSRLLGFIRDTIIARVFGTSMASNAFFIAFKIANLLRRILAEGALSQAFIPILVEYKQQQGAKATRVFIASIAGCLICVLTLMIILGIIAAPWLIMVIAPGFTHQPDKFILTTTLLRIILPYILFISLTYLGGAILNTWNYFLVPVFSPTLLNLSIIVFSLLVSQLFEPPIIALAWAVIVGGILQLCYHLPYLKQIDMLVVPRLQWRNSGVRRVLKNIGPAMLSVSINQLSIIINTMFASLLVSGSISWLYYADRLMELPLGTLGVALGTILFPSLSNSVTHGNYDEYSRLLDWGLRLCFMLALPSTLLLVILAYPLTVTFFQYGQFSTFDAIMTEHALIAYAVGLIGLLLVKVLTPGFYACHNIKTPILVAILTLAISQLMNLIFIGPLHHTGIALSIGLSACINAALLYWQLIRQKLFQPQVGWRIFLIRLLLAIMIMAVALFWMLSLMPNWTYSGMLWRMIRLIAIIIFAIIIYVTTLWLVGLRPHHFIRSVYNISSKY